MDIMFGEENPRYIKPKRKKKVKKSNHKHNYIWAIGQTDSEKFPEILVRYCTECGRVDNIILSRLYCDITDTKEYAEAKKNNPIIIAHSDNQFFCDMKYI